MVISMEDQVTYCNRTVQVGPHLLVVTTATMDTSGECLVKKRDSEPDRQAGKQQTGGGGRPCYRYHTACSFFVRIYSSRCWCWPVSDHHFLVKNETGLSRRLDASRRVLYLLYYI